MNHPKITAHDYELGYKRINLTLSIEEYDRLLIISSEKGIRTPGTLALSLLVQGINVEIMKCKNKELPGQQNIFKKGNRKK